MRTTASSSAIDRLQTARQLRRDRGFRGVRVSRTATGLRALAGLLALLGALAAPGPARAGVARLILAEDFTATWCPYCPHARCALEQMLEEYPEELIVVDEHWQDALATPWTEARKSGFYALGGLPLVVLDGTRFYFGASSCEGSAASYRSGIEARLASAPASPVRIDGLYVLDAEARTASISVSLLLEEAADLGETTAFLLVLENEVSAGGHTYYHVTRVAHETPVSLLAPGDLARVDAFLALDAVDDLTEIELIAFLQRTEGDTEVIQAARLGRTSGVPGAPLEPAPASAIVRVAPTPYAPGRAGEPLRIRLRLAESEGAWVSLDLIDAAGRRVARLAAGPLPAGEREISWHGASRAGLDAGRYTLRLGAPSGVSTAPLLWIP